MVARQRRDQQHGRLLERRELGVRQSFLKCSSLQNGLLTTFCVHDADVWPAMVVEFRSKAGFS
jgi:hypothetical protein